MVRKLTHVCLALIYPLAFSRPEARPNYQPVEATDNEGLETIDSASDRTSSFGFAMTADDAQDYLDYYSANSKIDDFIVNGNEAYPGQFPWQVSLRTISQHHLCGGALINKRHVLTAAHCEFILDSDLVILGDHENGWQKGREEGVTYYADEKHPHPKFIKGLTPPVYSAFCRYSSYMHN